LPSAAQTASQLAPKIYVIKLISTYEILWHPDCSCYRDSDNRAAGRRAGALFFARHLDYFIMTRNFTAIYRDLVPSRQITVTLGLASIYRDWQKTRHRDADANSLNRRAVSVHIQPTSQNQDSLINNFFDERISVLPRQFNQDHTNANSLELCRHFQNE
jgi:hypothetical protein